MTTETNDWQGRARREAVAICSGLGVTRSVGYEDLIGLMAIAWLQGVDLGSHETLSDVEDVFERMRVALIDAVAENL